MKVTGRGTISCYFIAKRRDQLNLFTVQCFQFVYRFSVAISGHPPCFQGSAEFWICFYYLPLLKRIRPAQFLIPRTKPAQDSQGEHYQPDQQKDVTCCFHGVPSVFLYSVLTFFQEFQHERHCLGYL